MPVNCLPTGRYQTVKNYIYMKQKVLFAVIILIICFSCTKRDINTQVFQFQREFPVLKSKNYNNVLQLTINTSADSLKQMIMKEIMIIIDGTTNISYSRDAVIKNGCMHYAPCEYHTLFLVNMESMDTGTAQRMLEFVKSVGRIFCIETYSDKSPGWKDHERRDKEVNDVVAEMKKYPDRLQSTRNNKNARPLNLLINYIKSFEI